MHSFLGTIESGEIELREHKSARWLTAETLNNVEWLSADKEVVDNLSAKLENQYQQQITHTLKL